MLAKMFLNLKLHLLKYTRFIEGVLQNTWDEFGYYRPFLRFRSDTSISTKIVGIMIFVWFLSAPLTILNIFFSLSENPVYVPSLLPFLSAAHTGSGLLKERLQSPNQHFSIFWRYHRTLTNLNDIRFLFY